MFGVSDAGLFLGSKSKKTVFDVVNKADLERIQFYKKLDLSEISKPSYIYSGNTRAEHPLLGKTVSTSNSKCFVYVSAETLSGLILRLSDSTSSSTIVDVNIGSSGVGVSGTNLSRTSYTWSWNGGDICLEVYASGGFKLNLYEDNNLVISGMTGDAVYSYVTFVQILEDIKSVMVVRKTSNIDPNPAEQQYFMNIFKQLNKEV